MSKSMKSEQKLTSLSFDPFPSFSILFYVKGEKGRKRKQKENALFLMKQVVLQLRRPGQAGGLHPLLPHPSLDSAQRIHHLCPKLPLRQQPFLRRLLFLLWRKPAIRVLQRPLPARTGGRRYRRLHRLPRFPIFHQHSSVAGRIQGFRLVSIHLWQEVAGVGAEGRRESEAEAEDKWASEA